MTRSAPLCMGVGFCFGAFLNDRIGNTKAEERQLQFPYFKVGVMNNPKWDKRYKGGEDSYVVDKSQRLVGVCDGVGGWGELEVCSGKFSKFLTKKLQELYERDSSRSLKDLLVESVKANPHGGSTTATLAKMISTNQTKGAPLIAEVQTCNLGDSAYIILRPKEDLSVAKIYRSKEQTYSFDFPYQCGQNCDLPYDAQDECHKVEHNDIIVLATDGVTDNVFDKQIIDECIYPHLKRTRDLTRPEDSALCISSMAEVLSYSAKHESPYTVSAVEHGKKRENNLGGKEDDITVVVAQVKLHH